MTEDKILWTAQYVEGDLSEAERSEFEALLSNDEELQQYLADYHQIHRTLLMELAEDRTRGELEQRLSSMRDDYFGAEKTRKTLPLGTYLRWASAVAAVLVIGLLVWAPWKGDLYEQFSNGQQMSVAERGAEKTELDAAATLFNDKKYAEAKPLLEKLHLADTQNTMVGYYYGITLIETHFYAQARQVLQDLYQGQSVFKYDAAYAMAMSYLKEGNKDECRNWLQKIPESAQQHQKAQELLKKL